MTKTIAVGWNFDNSYARLPQLFFKSQTPAKAPRPELVLFNEELATFLGLNSQVLQSGLGAAVFAGSKIPKGGEPLAQAYAGHQFGHFTMLGDGRALLVGEQITPHGERFDLQLKGSGSTPFSRGGDGKATLGPMLREYIISEAMHALGIPSTRSLAVVATGETVQRETGLPGAVLTRVAASHLRVGTFQYAAAWGTKKELGVLADYALKRHYPHLEGESNKYLAFLQEVVKAQASLISQWMLVGFIHGVMNTDNMSISGETIDYGPCAFLDTFDPQTVFSSIDAEGRYAYQNQPKMAAWNLARFAETLIPLLGDNQAEGIELAQNEVAGFAQFYMDHWFRGMQAKLGLQGKGKGDEELISDLLGLMYEHQADFTNTFLDLTFEQTDRQSWGRVPAFKDWQKRWQDRLQSNPGGWRETQKLMKRSNPALIPRNHQVEKALRAALWDQNIRPVQELLSALKNPYDHNPQQKKYAQPPPPSAIPYRTFCGT